MNEMSFEKWSYLVEEGSCYGWDPAELRIRYEEGESVEDVIEWAEAALDDELYGDAW